MKYVYLVWDTGGLRGVYEREIEATIEVHSIARDECGFDIDTPLDYSGALYRYGWDDVAWWTREIVY